MAQRTRRKIRRRNRSRAPNKQSTRRIARSALRKVNVIRKATELKEYYSSPAFHPIWAPTVGASQTLGDPRFLFTPIAGIKDFNITGNEARVKYINIRGRIAWGQNSTNTPIAVRVMLVFWKKPRTDLSDLPRYVDFMKPAYNLQSWPDRDIHNQFGIVYDRTWVLSDQNPQQQFAINRRVNSKFILRDFSETNLWDYGQYCLYAVSSYPATWDSGEAPGLVSECRVLFTDS